MILRLCVTKTWPRCYVRLCMSFCVRGLAILIITLDFFSRGGSKFIPRYKMHFIASIWADITSDITWCLHGGASSPFWLCYMHTHTGFIFGKNIDGKKEIFGHLSVTLCRHYVTFFSSRLLIDETLWVSISNLTSFDRLSKQKFY